MEQWPDLLTEALILALQSDTSAPMSTVNEQRPRPKFCEAKRNHESKGRDAAVYVEELDRYLCRACYGVYRGRKKRGLSAPEIIVYLDTHQGLVRGRSVRLDSAKVTEETYEKLERMREGTGKQSIYVINVELLELAARAWDFAEQGKLRELQAVGADFMALFLPPSPSNPGS